MSIEKVKAAAAAHTETYVEVPAGDLAQAFADAGEKPEKGSLYAHVLNVIDQRKRFARMRGEDPEQTPSPVLHVHRDAHLGKLLGVSKPAVES